MRTSHDVAVIGLGPAGMAVSIMASHMGLKVVGIESRSLGGECLSVGCIPSKALLRIASHRHRGGHLEPFGLSSDAVPRLGDPLNVVRQHVRFVIDEKTQKMFAKVDLKLGEGAASFVDPHTISVGQSSYSAKKIFVCTGTQPARPPIPGLRDTPHLTNETLFSLDRIPESLVVIGGGAIGCEMAQAFSRLGSRVSIVHMDLHLLPHGDPEAGELLGRVFEDEGIGVYNHRAIRSVAVDGAKVVVRTDRGETLVGEKLLVAAGRVHDLAALRLENAGVAYDETGIRVDRFLRTTRRHIFAPGDVNGPPFFSHAAMHQGMIALLNAILPRVLARDVRKYVVPWTVFTDPPVAHVGKLEREIKAAGIDYEIIEERYEDYGAAIAEGVGRGSVRAYVSPSGRIYGVRIVGEGAGEMINEWGLAIQQGLRIHRIMFLQHAFPSMSFLTKRVSERWMMKRMESPLLKRLIRLMF